MSGRPCQGHTHHYRKPIEKARALENVTPPSLPKLFPLTTFPSIFLSLVLCLHLSSLRIFSFNFPFSIFRPSFFATLRELTILTNITLYRFLSPFLSPTLHFPFFLFAPSPSPEVYFPFILSGVLFFSLLLLLLILFPLSPTPPCDLKMELELKEENADIALIVISIVSLLLPFLPWSIFIFSFNLGYLLL